jgi:hypothetical protein
MISYPGDILARFGRYEAVEDLGPAARAHLWRAWDPYLERSVVIAALPDLEQNEMYRTLPDLGRVFKEWLDVDEPSIVLDFGPGGGDEPPFLVFPPTDPEEKPPPPPPPPPPLPAGLPRTPLLLAAGAGSLATLLLVLVAWLVGR